MPEDNLSLQFQAIDKNTNLNNVMIGDSRFTDDIWDLRRLITKKSLQDNKKILKFKFILNEDMKITVKHYAYYKLGKTKPVSVKRQINAGLPAFIEYCNIKGINSFSEITMDDFLSFSIWLKDVKSAGKGYGYLCSFVIEDIIKVGQTMGWNVPRNNIFKGVTSSNLWSAKADLNAKKTRPIPENIYDKILYHAVHDEKDMITKAGIIIQSQTGLRIEEVFTASFGCVKTTSDGYEYIELELGKTEKGEPISHKVFINRLVKDVIRELEEATKELREESGLNELFLCRVFNKQRTIGVYSTISYTQRKLSKFIERWNIRDNKGELYPLKSHQFRATFVRELIKRKVPIAIIFKQFAHVSIEMTMHYLTLQQEEVKEIYSDMILNPASKIAGLRAQEIKGKLNELFKGKTENEIEQAISDLSSTMSFNPLPTGMCLYDFRRGNCTDGDGCFFYNCPNYITEVSFYPLLKDELNLMEIEMTRLKELGRERDWERQYIKYKYLKPLVESLEVLINDKEKVG